MLTLGSLFDGSGGFPLAGAMNGFEPVWASEVEPYPIAVTRSRFPQMLHLGNVCDVNGATVRPVDVVTFGSPCQDLSVAGKRAGLKHEDHGDDETTRSGLFMEAVRIITEMRKATNGRYPTFAVWENVPGALSSSGGDDFLAVLENLAKIADPEVSIPKPDKWCANGDIVGNGFSIAWRIIDARHFGVTVRDRDTGDVLVRGTPQRRRRIYLVADFRGERAGKILFECAGVQGNSEPCAETRQGASTDAEGSVGADDGEGTGFDGYNGDVTGDVSATLGVNCGISTGRNGVVVPYTLKIRSGVSVDSYGKAAGKGALIQTDKAATLAATQDQYLSQPVSYAIDQQGGKGGIAVLFENHSQDTRFKGPLDVSPMLPAQLGTGGNNTPFVVEQTYCLQGSMIGRADKNGPQGDGVNEDVSFTCNTTDRHAVAYAVGNGQADQSDLHDVPGALNCMHDQQAVLVAAVDCRNGAEDPDTNGTLQAKPNGGTSINYNNVVRKNYLVRRLTPTECARLQGFPDLWGYPNVLTTLSDDEYTFWQTVRDTYAEINGKPQKTYKREQMLKWYNNLHTDSAEYKMWGNGIALPCTHFVLNRIAKELNNHDNQNPTADA